MHWQAYIAQEAIQPLVHIPADAQTAPSHWLLLEVLTCTE